MYLSEEILTENNEYLELRMRLSFAYTNIKFYPKIRINIQLNND